MFFGGIKLIYFSNFVQPIAELVSRKQTSYLEDADSSTDNVGDAVGRGDIVQT